MSHIYGDPDTRSLHQAAFYGYTAQLSLLLDEGTDVNEFKEGSTPLHLAASAGKSECVRILLERGADPNPFDDQDFTPLLLAVRYGLQHDPDAVAVRHLLQGGAYTNLPDLFPDLSEPWGETPLLLAATEGNLTAIRLLVEAGARVNDPSYWGTTPLIAAIASPSPYCVRYLIQQGADVNLQPRNGWSTLHYAVSRRDPEMVDILVQAGTDVNAEDKDGKSVLMLAQETGDAAILQTLQNAGAK